MMSSSFLGLMRSRPIGILLTGSAACLVVSGCGASSAEPSSSGDGLSTIRVTNPANISNVPLHLAMDKGYFEDEGIKIEADVDLGAGSTVEAVIGGQVDMAWSNVGGAIAPYSEGIDLRLVALTDHGVPEAMQVLVKGDSDIQSLADLKGKTMAILSPTTTCAWIVKAALKEQGLDENSIEMTEISPPDHPTALDAGQVDSTCTTDPTKTVMVQELGARSVFDAATDGLDEYASYPVGGYVVAGSYAEKNPEVIEGFQNALRKAAEYANENPDEVRAALPSFTTVDPELTDEVVVNEFVDTQDPAELRADVQLVLDAMVETGLLESPVDLDNFLVLG